MVLEHQKFVDLGKLQGWWIFHLQWTNQASINLHGPGNATPEIDTNWTPLKVSLTLNTTLISSNKTLLFKWVRLLSVIDADNNHRRIPHRAVELCENFMLSWCTYAILLVARTIQLGGRKQCTEFAICSDGEMSPQRFHRMKREKWNEELSKEVI